MVAKHQIINKKNNGTTQKVIYRNWYTYPPKAPYVGVEQNLDEALAAVKRVAHVEPVGLTHRPVFESTNSSGCMPHPVFESTNSSGCMPHLVFESANLSGCMTHPVFESACFSFLFPTSLAGAKANPLSNCLGFKCHPPPAVAPCYCAQADEWGAKLAAAAARAAAEPIPAF